MPDTRGRRITKPWYQREPYPSMVGALIAHELLTEGGTASLKLTARVARAAREAPAGRSSEQILAQLWIEEEAGNLTPGPHGHERRREAAHDLLDVLVDHGELLT